MEAVQAHSKPMDVPRAPKCLLEPRCAASGSPKADPPNTKAPTVSPCFVEVFAGSARLRHSMRSKGFDVLAIDAPNNRRKSLAPGTIYDLTSSVCQEELKISLGVRNMSSAFIAVCRAGPGSRAREKPLPAHLKAQGAPEPRPLRDCEHILGLPGLSLQEQARVSAANQLAKFVVELLRLSIEIKCFLSIENPLNSWMWAVLAHYVREAKDKKLARAFEGMVNVDFSMCMWGGDRPKSTRFKCTDDRLLSMALDCDGSHKHKPYTIFQEKGGWKFDAAAEEYPQKLCDEVARLFASVTRVQEPDEPIKRPCVRQTRRRAQLIPEFKQVVDFRPDSNSSLAFKTLAPPDKSQGEKFGIFHTKEEFCAEAAKLPHPSDTFNCIPDAARVECFRLLTCGISGPSKERIANQAMIAQAQKELRVAEARLHSTFPLHAQRVLEGKNLLLWHHRLKKSGFPDLGVWDLMLGTDLVGTPTKSPLYGWKEKPPTLSPDTLLQSATWRRRRVAQSSVHADDEVLQSKFWELATLWSVWSCSAANC